MKKLELSLNECTHSGHRPAARLGKVLSSGHSSLVDYLEEVSKCKCSFSRMFLSICRFVFC